MVKMQFGSTVSPQEDLQPILREEIEIALAAVKKGKSGGLNHTPATDGETMIDVITEICNRIWRMAYPKD